MSLRSALCAWALIVCVMASPPGPALGADLSLTLWLRDGLGGAGIPGRVSVSPAPGAEGGAATSPTRAQADAAGRVPLTLPPGAYHVRALAVGYEPLDATLSLAPGGPPLYTLLLEPAPWAQPPVGAGVEGIGGAVIDGATGRPMAGVGVQDLHSGARVFTGREGTFLLPTSPDEGPRTILIEAEGWSRWRYRIPAPGRGVRLQVDLHRGDETWEARALKAPPGAIPLPEVPSPADALALGAPDPGLAPSAQAPPTQGPQALRLGVDCPEGRCEAIVVLPVEAFVRGALGDLFGGDRSLDVFAAAVLRRYLEGRQGRPEAPGIDLIIGRGGLPVDLHHTLRSREAALASRGLRWGGPTGDAPEAFACLGRAQPSPPPPPGAAETGWTPPPSPEERCLGGWPPLEGGLPEGVAAVHGIPAPGGAGILRLDSLGGVERVALGSAEPVGGPGAGGSETSAGGGEIPGARRIALGPGGALRILTEGGRILGADGAVLAEGTFVDMAQRPGAEPLLLTFDGGVIQLGGAALGGDVLAQARAVDGLPAVGGGYVLDGAGALTPFGGASPWPGPPPSAGVPAAVDLALTPGGLGGFALTEGGEVLPLGDAPAPRVGCCPGGGPAQALLVDPDLSGGQILFADGRLQAFTLPVAEDARPSRHAGAPWILWRGGILTGPRSAPRRGGGTPRGALSPPVALASAGEDAYALEESGGLRALEGASPRAGMLASRAVDVALTREGGILLDTLGILHPLSAGPREEVTEAGAAPVPIPLSDPPLARPLGLARDPGGGGWVLLEGGGLIPFGGAPPLRPEPCAQGAPRDLLPAPGGGLLLLCPDGAVQALGGAGEAIPTLHAPGWAMARALIPLPSSGDAPPCAIAQTLDTWGRLHPVLGAACLDGRAGGDP